MEIDDAYTQADHNFRENDSYALAKYAISLRWLGEGNGRRMLNVGCGSGLFNHLARNAGFLVEACEPDPVARARAIADAVPGVLIHDTGLFDIVPLDPPDVVVMHDVLEHVDEEGRAVDRLAEILGPNGAVIISVPALPRLFGYHDEQLGHYRRYTSASLKVALGRRFDVKKMRYFGGSFIPVTYWFSRRQRRPYPSNAAVGINPVATAFDLLCRLETAVPAPLGTSLLCLASPNGSA